MKKILCLTAALALLAAPAFARDVDRGTIELGGGMSFQYSNKDWKFDDSGAKTDSSGWSLNGQGLYYFRDNLGLGADLRWDHSNVDDFETTFFFLGPVVTYNLSMNERVSIPVFASLGYASVDWDTDKASGWGWLAGAGVKYFMAENLSLNFMVDYMSQSLEDGDTLTVDGFDVFAGFSIYLGGMNY